MVKRALRVMRIGGAVDAEGEEEGEDVLADDFVRGR